MTDTDDLTDLILDDIDSRFGTDHSHRLIARHLAALGYRRVVIDDAMIERARKSLYASGRKASVIAVRAALTAALAPKDQPHEKAVGAPANWVHGYLPCGCCDDGQGRHVR